MARPGERDLVQLGPWPSGANNITREDSVPGGAFRKGVNVDVYPGGKVRRRSGCVQLNGTPTENLWSHGRYALCTVGTSLCRFVPGQPPTTISVGLVPDADIAYCAVNDLIYVSDGLNALRVNTHDDSVRPWGVASPAGQPTLIAVAGGLDAGKYQVAVTYSTADGEESGTGLAAIIDLPTGGGIQVVAGAPSVQAYIQYINVYMTRTNGTELLFYDSYPIGALNITLDRQSLREVLNTFGLEPMPAGSAAALVGGMLVVAVKNMLVWSDPLWFGLTNLAKNYYLFVDEIDMLAPTALGAASDGLFVAAGDRTVFIAGADIARGVNKLAYDAGAVRGAPIYENGDSFELQDVPPAPMPVWLAKNGYPCLGMSDGTVKALTANKYAMQIGERVSLASRNLSGVNQMLASVRSPNGTSVGATSDTATSVLIRNGVVID